MSKIKLVVCDMDGTLLDQYGVFNDSNFEALIKLKNNGIKIAVATGRNIILINEKVRSCCDFLLTSNGATIYQKVDKNFSKIFTKKIDKEDALLYTKAVKKFATCYQVLYENSMISTDDKSFLEFSHKADFLVKQGFDPLFCDAIFQYKVELNNNYVDAIERNNQDVDKLDLLYDPKNSNEVLKIINKFDKINSIICYPGSIEALSFGANKGEAVLKICEVLKIKPENVLCFGDSGNDLDMKKIGCKFIAVDNAPDFVKFEADDVCGKNSESGVGKFINVHINEF